VKSRPDAAVFFFDEGRFGLQPCLGKRWGRRGVRPIALVKTGYANFYSFSAVCPATGEHETLFLPWVNTAMMNIYLEHLGSALNGRQCLLILDQAGWHKSKELKAPKNIELVYLPPRSPELNPVEHLWDWLKRNCVRNRFYRSLNEIMDSLQEGLKEATPLMLKSLCGCKYLAY